MNMTLRRLFGMAIVGLAVFTGPGCRRPGGDGGDDATSKHLLLTGSSTVAPLAADLAAAYEEEYPEVRIDVQMGGSSRGIADARSGLADIGMASRALKDSEADLLYHTVAMDGICMVVHASNAVSALTDGQIKAIYTGAVTNWKDVGGEDAEITVVNKAEGRSTLELFLHYFGLEAAAIEADVVIGDNQQGIKTVAGNPHAIGYVSIGTAEYEVGQGTPLRLLPVGGVEASVANVRNKTFPLSRPLNFVTAAAPEGLAADFLAYAQSGAAAELIGRHYFVPLSR